MSPTVYDYQTGSALPGRPTPALIEASRNEDPTGVVRAFKTDDGQWSPVPAPLAGQGKAFGFEERTVYVE